MKTLATLLFLVSFSASADTSPHAFGGKAFHCAFEGKTFFAFDTFDFQLGKELSEPNGDPAVYAAKISVDDFGESKTEAKVSSFATRVTTGEHIDVPVPGVGLTLQLHIVETSDLPGKIPLGVTGLAVSNESSDHPMAPLPLLCSATN